MKELWEGTKLFLLELVLLIVVSFALALVVAFSWNYFAITMGFPTMTFWAAFYFLIFVSFTASIIKL